MAFAFSCENVLKGNKCLFSIPKASYVALPFEVPGNKQQQEQLEYAWEKRELYSHHYYVINDEGLITGKESVLFLTPINLT